MANWVSLRPLIFVSFVLAAAGCGSDEGKTAAVAVAGSDSGLDPFDDSVLSTYELTVDGADWAAIVADPHDDTWRRCRVVWQGEVYDDVALRPSGQRSRIPGNPKPSLRLDFDEWRPDREFHKLSSLKLDAMVHDSSMMRARLQYAAYEARGIPSPRYVHARLIVNGEYKGLYGVEERVTKEFVRTRFGRPVEQLYEWSGREDDLVWIGPNEPFYVPHMWRNTNEELPSGASEIQDLVFRLNQDAAAAPWDVESFLNFIAVEMATGEGDSYIARHDGHTAANLFLYRSPATGRFLFLPWDKDQGFWRVETSITHAFDNRILTRNFILSMPANLARYKQILRELLAGPWSTGAVRSRIDAVFRQIRDAAFEDPLKPYTNDKVVDHVEWLKTYVGNRNRAFQDQLSP